MTLPNVAVGDLVTASGWNDLVDEVNGYTGAWTSWTPALTASTTNPTLGTGGSTSGKYVKIGRTVMGWGYIKFGTSGQAAGSGTYLVSLPVAQAETDNNRINGDALLRANATFTRAFLLWNGSTTCTLRYTSAAAAGTLVSTTNAAPAAWAAAGDDIRYSFRYEAAS